MSAGPGVEHKRVTRGLVELRGRSWWNRYREEAIDGATGELIRRETRMRLGTRAELRTRRAAEEWLDRYLAMMTPKTLTPGTPITAVQYCERYVSVHVPLMRRTTRRTYTRIIRRELEPAFGRKRLDQIDAAVLQGVIAARAQTHARATVRLLRTVGLQVLRQARRDGFAAHVIDPPSVRLPKTQVAESEQRHIAERELALIVRESPWPARAMWAALGYAALRIGEGLGLTWQHVDFERQVLRIRQASVDGQLAPLKTAASRADLPLLPQLDTVLREYRAVWRPNDEQLLFASRRGTPLRADDVRRRWLAPQLARLGLPAAGCHAFRHGAPARLNDMGLSPAAVQRFMRHTDLQTTQRYLHFSAETAWAEIAAVTRRRNTAQLATSCDQN